MTPKDSIDSFIAVLKPAVELITEFFKSWEDELEPFMRFETLHPRKKPRGSMRRFRKERRNDT